MTFFTAALIGAGGAIVGGLVAGDSARKASNTQADAARDAADAQLTGVRESNALQGDMFNKNLALTERVYNEGVERQRPFYDAGITAQNQLMDLLGLSNRTGAAGYGSLTRNFGMSDFQADPGYGFRLSEGLKSLDRQAAARGGLISGSALKAAQRYGQNLASDEYQNAFNRYQVNRANRLNPLQSFLGQGQSSANTLNSMGSNYANAVSSLGSNYANAVGGATMTGANAMANGILGTGAARASGYMGGANALTGMISGIGNNLMDWRMLSTQPVGRYSTGSVSSAPGDVGMASWYDGFGGGGASGQWIPDLGP